jgi:NAD(P)-dependent dehydrogenase (short-subunit alcohol dehydrogenase family)
VSDISFDGRVAVVTGAGGGLGRTYALELASAGPPWSSTTWAAASKAGRRPHRGAEGRRRDHRQGRARRPELRLGHDARGRRQRGQTAVDSFGKVDVVINNAGFLRDKSFLKLTWEDLDAIIDVHLKAAFYVSQPAFAVMKEQGYGRFVFTASNATFGNFGQSNYSAAKMGLVGLSNTIAVEGARAGILSNVIMPVAKTRMTEELLGDFANYLAPELVTPMVTYLCSEACTRRTAPSPPPAGATPASSGACRRAGTPARARPRRPRTSGALRRDHRREGYIVPQSTTDEIVALSERFTK